jgi:hypothetical protein
MRGSNPNSGVRLPISGAGRIIEASFERRKWHQVSIDPYWLELIVGDLSRSTYRAPAAASVMCHDSVHG